MDTAPAQATGRKTRGGQTMTVDVDAIRLELAAYYQEGADPGGHTMEDIAAAMGCGVNKARTIVRAAIRAGGIEVRNVATVDMAGRNTTRPRYFFVNREPESHE